MDNLLSFSQIGRASLQWTNVNTALLVQEVKDDAVLDAMGRDIEWRIRDLARVRGDLFMLRVVFQNLISNAIEIGARRDGGETTFHIRDNGVGFDAQYASKLFGIFQRLHRMEDFEGTGIGLANVRRIISRHGGRTWAEGDMNRGATFYFTLPDFPDARGQATKP